MKKQICTLIAACMVLAGCENEAPTPTPTPTYSDGAGAAPGNLEGRPEKDAPAIEQVAE